MAATASGTISAQNTNTASWASRGGPMLINLTGATFGTGTVTLQASTDMGATWTTANYSNTATAITWTAAGARVISDCVAGVRYRLSIGAATTPSIPWTVVQRQDL